MVKTDHHFLKGPLTDYKNNKHILYNFFYLPKSTQVKVDFRTRPACSSGIRGAGVVFEESGWFIGVE